MAELSPNIDRRPAIQVVTYRADAALLLPVLCGIEEEQIPAEVGEAVRGGAAELADQAAHASALNVGIAFDGEAGEISLSHRDLSGRPPLFLLTRTEFTPLALARLGKNAARLVKGDPLEFADDDRAPKAPPPRWIGATAPAATVTPSAGDAELIQKLADMILERLAKSQERK